MFPHQVQLTGMYGHKFIEIADVHQARHQELAMQGVFPAELAGGEKTRELE